MAICFGGRVAEEVIFGKDNISTGAGGGQGSGQIKLQKLLKLW